MGEPYASAVQRRRWDLANRLAWFDHRDGEGEGEGEREGDSEGEGEDDSDELYRTRMFASVGRREAGASDG